MLRLLVDTAALAVAVIAGLFAAARRPFMLQNVGGAITRAMVVHLMSAFPTATFKCHNVRAHTITFMPHGGAQLSAENSNLVALKWSSKVTLKSQESAHTAFDFCQHHKRCSVLWLAGHGDLPI
jgi:hypothetical protein